MNGDAGRHLLVAVVEHDPALENPPDHAADMLDAVGPAQLGTGRAAPGRVGELGLLEVEAGSGEMVERAGVVVMQMGDDDVGDLFGANAEHGETLAWQPVDLAPAAGGFFGVEAEVDEGHTIPRSRKPDVEVDRHRRGIVRIDAQEILSSGARREPSVADREDFPEHDRRAPFVLRRKALTGAGQTGEGVG